MTAISPGTTTSGRAVLNLQEIAAKTRDLPPMPVTALKALEMTKDPKTSARDLQAVISRDQALTAKILRIVNSAMYCLSREVSTVSHAVAILGMETLRSIIMAASIQQVLRAGMVHGRDLGTKLLADHSWGAALAARITAQRVRYANPEEAFLAGLMHDIGKPVLLKNFPDQYTPILGDVYRGGESFHDAELRTFGFSHAQVGALLAEKWNFPTQLAEAIGYHHNPESAPNHSQLASIVNMANQCMIRMEIGFERNKAMELEQEPSAHHLKLSKTIVEALLVEIQTALAEMPAPMSF